MSKVMELSALKIVATNSDHSLNCFKDILSTKETDDGVALERAVSVLQAGGVIAIPTDTIYGVAALSQSTEAVDKLYQIKGRNCLKPVAICVGSIPEIFQWCKVTVSDTVLRRLLPGPVTLVFERQEALNPQLNSHTQLVGVRIPNHSFVRALSRACRQPLALTSANVSDQPSSLSIYEFESLWPRLGLIVDEGHLGTGKICRLGSTVVDLSTPGSFTFIRPGCAETNTRSILLSCGLTELTGSSRTD